MMSPSLIAVWTIGRHVGQSPKKWFFRSQSHNSTFRISLIRKPLTVTATKKKGRDGKELRNEFGRGNRILVLLPNIHPAPFFCRPPRSQFADVSLKHRRSRRPVSKYNRKRTSAGSGFGINSMPSVIPYLSHGGDHGSLELVRQGMGRLGPTAFQHDGRCGVSQCNDHSHERGRPLEVFDCLRSGM
jgi:hypothetical protein